MIYQLTWKILPGLRGLSCSDFRATPTAAPNTEQGVAIECANATECEALLRDLESHFGPAALFQQRLGLRNGENLRARKNGGETVTHRVLTSGGLQAGEFLIATVAGLENNSSPCKQRRNQISNSNKNGIWAFRTINRNRTK